MFISLAEIDFRNVKNKRSMEKEKHDKIPVFPCDVLEMSLIVEQLPRLDDQIRTESLLDIFGKHLLPDPDK
ncbi:MAG: hypothetical protein H8E57_05655 [Candidatus Cloacimonetes bacterium]|nr:hypothetical protein [Candidatus Cloacimonadota bacterium]